MKAFAESLENETLLDRELLTVEQVADYLQVHPETVRKWLREGRLAGVNLGGRARWRVRRDDLTRFVSTPDGPDDHLVMRDDFRLATYAGLVESVRDARTSEDRRSLYARLVGWYRQNPMPPDPSVRTAQESAVAFLNEALESDLVPLAQKDAWRDEIATVLREQAEHK
jgi:excisionase family DNA binding protein